MRPPASPPGLAEAVLRRFLPEEIAEAVLGDLEEGFRHRVERGGPRGARLWYWYQVVRLPYGTLRREVTRLRESRWKSVRNLKRGGNGMGRFGEEVRIGARNLARRPGFSAVVVTTLALSIGAATLIFSALETVLLRTLPYPDADRIVTLYGLNESWRESQTPQLRQLWNRYPVSLGQLDAAAGGPGIVSAGGAGTGQAILRGRGPARRIPLATVTAGLFETLGVQPEMGRLPTQDELSEGASVVVVSHGFWTNVLGRDPGVVGTTLQLEGEARTVVGVMPRGFFFPDPGPELWMPFPPSFLETARGVPVSAAVARMREGADVEDVSSDLDARVRALAEADPAAAGSGMRAVLRRDETIEDLQKGLSLFAGAVALVVVLAAVNLASLVLARASRRRGELAIRRALGGGRGSVVWTVMSEVLLLCGMGGAIGVLGALVLKEPFAEALDAVGLLGGVPVEMNTTVLVLAAATTLLAAVGAGFPVAWRASRAAPAATLAGGRGTDASRGAGGTQRALLGAESALAFVLLFSAALFLQNAAAVTSLDPGYEQEGLQFIELRPASDRYPEEVARLDLFGAVTRRVADRVGSVATLVQPLPSVGEADVEELRTADDEESAQVPMTRVGPAFFEVVGLSLLRGRGLGDGDGPESPPVVVVSESLARRLGGGDIVGQSVVVGRGEEEHSATVVGVVPDARVLALPVEGGAHLYVPLAQDPSATVSVLTRPGGAEVGAAALREAALSVDSDLVLGRSGTLSGLTRSLLAPFRVRALLLSGLAGLALVLACVGVFGVVAHVVEDRTREFGIRMALGATPGQEILRVVRSFLAVVGLGTAAGLAVTGAASGVLGSFLTEVQVLDPMSYVGVALLIPAVGALAAWVPARRAAGIDPGRVLDRE